MKSWISIKGLYEFDNSLFDGMLIPEGLNKEILIENLCIQLAEFEILYADPRFMKAMITSWSTKMLGNWNRLISVYNAEYNPIHNYDRTETRSNTATAEASNDSTVKGYNAAFNESSMVQNTEGKDNSTSVGTNTFSEDLKIQGNIGVMSTQDMINQEISLWGDFNIYQSIIDDFAKRFCLLLY